MVPAAKLNKMNKTKIIATVGPATDDYESILQLIKSGASGLRLNFSHGTYQQFEKIIKYIRKASIELKTPVAIIQDLQGPKIRLGDFDGVIKIDQNQSLVFQYKADYERSGYIPLQYDLSKKVSRGESMLLFDGKIRTRITSVKDGLIHARAENSGYIISRKGINLPDTDFSGDIITPKDGRDIAFGSEHDVDYVALSFVQSAEDIDHLRKKLAALSSRAKVIAKIETRSAIDNIESIIQETDVVMVARGDLAIETEPESVPIMQRRIIGYGLRYKKPTIVATHLLSSMTDTPEPTRAEVSDVATSVIVGADCVMLSEETASGKYPIDAVKIMKKVIIYTQENSDIKATFPNIESDESQTYAISRAIIYLAEQVKARAIVAETKSGRTAINIASQRPAQPIVAVASDEKVTNQLSIVYGLESFTRSIDKYAATKQTNWLLKNKVFEKNDIIVTASGKYPGVAGATDTIKVRVM